MADAARAMIHPIPWLQTRDRSKARGSCALAAVPSARRAVTRKACVSASRERERPSTGFIVAEVLLSVRA
jgi:hypothetical protein